MSIFVDFFKFPFLLYVYVIRVTVFICTDIVCFLSYKFAYLSVLYHLCFYVIMLVSEVRKGHYRFVNIYDDNIQSLFFVCFCVVYFLYEPRGAYMLAGWGCKTCLTLL